MGLRFSELLLPDHLRNEESSAVGATVSDDGVLWMLAAQGTKRQGVLLRELGDRLEELDSPRIELAPPMHRWTLYDSPLQRLDDGTLMIKGQGKVFLCDPKEQSWDRVFLPEHAEVVWGTSRRALYALGENRLSWFDGEDWREVEIRDRTFPWWDETGEG